MECRDVCLFWVEEDGCFLDWRSWCTVSYFPVLENPLNKMIDVFADEAWPYTQAVM